MVGVTGPRTDNLLRAKHTQGTSTIHSVGPVYRPGILTQAVMPAKPPENMTQLQTTQAARQ
jgi:hypothetical protein